MATTARRSRSRSRLPARRTSPTSERADRIAFAITQSFSASPMRRINPPSLALAHVVIGLTVVALAGCHDDCDSVGDVRCVGSKVQICGYIPGDSSSWDEASDCAVFAAECSADKPGRAPDSYCTFSDFVCEGTHGALCHGDAVVSCEASGAPARLQQPCEHECVDNGDSSFCSAQPLAGNDSGEPDAGS